MTKPQLRMLAIVLSGLILVVLFAGIDDLPRRVRADIASEQQSLGSVEKDLQKARADVERIEPELNPPGVDFMEGGLLYEVNHVDLRAARKDMDALAAFAKANRRRDEDKVEQTLREERSLRAAAADEIAKVERGVQDVLHFEQHLPDEMARMEREHQALRGIDLGPVTAVVKKAEIDWPEKQTDLENRLPALSEWPANAEKWWQKTANLRSKAAAGESLAKPDCGLLLVASTSLHWALDVTNQAKQLQDLTGQLYDSWDKILVDLEIRRSGERRYYDEKIRTVRTHLIDVAAKQAETKPAEERWVDVSKAQYEAVENDLGMAIEHKAAGKYDSEAERVAQPAGFAYVAPPAQGSNQYGYWTHRDGGSFWVWLPQYLILRDLLYAHDYRPLSTMEWEEYRTVRSSGRTYYGHDATAGASAPKYGSQGTFTQRRYADSNYARNGGYRDSRYATGAGGYRGSRFESRGAQSGQSSEPRTFGNHSPGASPRATPRSAPPRSTPRSPGRSFGGRRR